MRPGKLAAFRWPVGAWLNRLTEFMNSPEHFRKNFARWAPWGFVLVAIVFAAAVRFRLLEMPLERDEGEYAYAGQLMLQGIPPYKLAYNMKLPGTYAAYALIMAVFGQTIRGIHLGLLVVNAATIVLVFLLGRRLFDSFVGVVAAASFAVLSMGQTILGMAAHASHFVILPVVGGMLLLLRAVRSERLSAVWGSGLLFGLGFLMKQPGVFFGLFGLAYLLWSDWRRRSMNWRRIAAFLCGAAIPFGATCIILFAAGVFDRFWFWTFTYAREYVSLEPLSSARQTFWWNFTRVVEPALWLWLLAGVGLVTLLLKKKWRDRVAVVAGFAGFSILAVCPGFYFRGHYFIMVLPAVALLIGVAISAARETLSDMQFAVEMRDGLPVLLFCVALLMAVRDQWAFFFRLPVDVACRLTYRENPFPESVVIADYIRAHSRPDARLAVIGSEPQIYFYSNRRSATGYIYTYGLIERQRLAVEMQQEMIAEIEAAAPEYMVYVNVVSSWLVRPNSQNLIFKWRENFVGKNYDLIGVADILLLERTEYRWGEEAKKYTPRSRHFVLVHKRKTS